MRCAGVQCSKLLLALRSMVRIVYAATLFAAVCGHGDLNIPLPRNNRGAQPIDTPPGESHGPSCLGDACGWFQAGCCIGCDVCGNQTSGGADCSPENPCSPDTVPCKAMEPTLPDEFRTYNLDGLSSNGDWTRYHPWRAPGHAPVGDACGVAGAYSPPGIKVSKEERLSIFGLVQGRIP